MHVLPPDSSDFPDVNQADADGRLAIGGNLFPATLIKAFRKGIFPWYNQYEPICWYSPPTRCILYADEIVISKSMKQVIKRETFQITRNNCFADVIKHCAQVRREGQSGTWIVQEMQEAYIRLHQLGIAHSVEVWHEGKLVGGLYGVALSPKIFSGESMFSLMPNASKAALIHLCQNHSYEVIDCQVPSAHLMSMGAIVISRGSYLALLQRLS